MLLSPPLKIHQLSKRYGQLLALNHVSFVLKKGEVFGLLGPNGAGKTSIISIIVTLERATSGQVEVFGHEVSQSSRQAKVMTGVVPQELINHGYFNLSEVLRFHSGYYGIWNNRSREEYLLQRLGLWEHRSKKVKQLSGGMKRRLLIAKALVHHPPLLLLDEPTAGVDIDLREDLWKFVAELKAEGVTILLTTHYLEEAEKLCDRVGVIHRGHILKVGETKDLIADLTQRRIHLFFKNVPPIDVSNNEFFMKQDKNKVIFQVPAKMGVGELLERVQLKNCVLEDIKIEEGSLEDAFRQILLRDNKSEKNEI